VLLTIAVSITTACSTGRSSTFSTLSEQGILTVSSDNPYVGANIFLANEMEESRYLHNFLKEKGAPQAIELNGQTIEGSELKLFYSGRQEMYSAVPQFDRSLGTKEWIVRGPYALDRASFRQVSSLPSSKGGVFQISGRREVLGGELQASETRVIAPVYIETPRPKPIARRAKAKKTAAPTVVVAEDPLKNPSNLDQQALAEARQGNKASPPKSSEPGITVTIGSSQGATKPPAAVDKNTSAKPIASPSPTVSGTHAAHK
jgi:hypothetical protein